MRSRNPRPGSRANRYRNAAFAVMLVACTCAAQTATAPADPFSQELSKYPGLMPEFGKLAERLRNEVQLPPDRNRSQVLPLLPDATTYYAAFGNYGDAVHQALGIFHDELNRSAVLRDWWEHTFKGADAAKFDDAVEKFYGLSQYMGDEIVISGNTADKDAFVMVAPVRKPGLKSFLEDLLRQWPALPHPILRVFNAQELAGQRGEESGRKAPVIVVRTDFVIAAPDLESAKTFNQKLNGKNQTFPATPFGARLVRAYQDGTGLLAAADLHEMLHHLPAGEPPQTQEMLMSTGFDNVQFLVWQHKGLLGQSGSQMEITFNGPRHGVPSWLAAPGELGSLDFVSPKALMVWAIKLKNLAEIFDDVRQLATLTNPAAFASFDQMQQMMGINLRNDLLGHLQGETTFEVDGVTGQQPEWKAVLRVNDPERLQQAIIKLAGASGQAATPTLVDGVNYYSFVVPSPKSPMQISYAFVDGYMVVASSRQLAEESIHGHRSGTSLAKSAKFLSSAESGPGQASALMYYDTSAMWTARLQTASPEVAQLFSSLQSTPVVIRTYAEEDKVRVVSNSGGADAGAFLIFGAIAVPNLLQARISANEATAVGTMRSIVTAQVAYSAAYRPKGFARDLATLSAGSHGANDALSQHARLLDWTQGDASCDGPTSCDKSGYRFTMFSRCTQSRCEDFTAVATPVSRDTGIRSFCATSDGVVRFSSVAPAAGTLNSAECDRWTPLQ